MPFSLESWKTEIGDYFQTQSDHLQPAGVDTLYGWLVIKTLLPAVVATQLRDPAVNQVVTRIVKNGSAGPILALLQRWPGHPEGELASEVFAAARTDPGLRQALDVLFQKLDVIALARAGLAEADRQRFTETLDAELKLLGSRLDTRGDGLPAASPLNRLQRLPRPQEINPWLLGLGLTVFILLLLAILGWSSANRALQAWNDSMQLLGVSEDNLRKANADLIQAEEDITEIEAAQLAAVAETDLVLARQLSAQAQLLWLTQPDQIDLTTLLAIEAGQRLFVSGEDETLREAASLLPTEIMAREHLNTPTVIALSSAGDWVVSGDASGSLRIWDIETGEQHLVFRRPSQIESVTISPDDRWIAVTDQWDTVLVDTTTWTQADSWMNSKVAAFSPSGHQALVWAWPDIRTLDLDTRNWQTGPALQLLQVGQFYYDDIIISTNLNWAAAKMRVMKKTQIVDLTTGAIVPEITGWKCPPLFSPDGRYTLTCNLEGFGQLWDVASRQEVVRFDAAHWDTVQALAFSPDGTRVASGGEDGTVRIWNAASGREMLMLDHQSAVMTVSFSPDGTRLASGGEDGSIRVWDLAAGQEIMRVKHAREISNLVFTRDGSRLISTGSDVWVRVWQMNADLDMDVDLSSFDTLLDGDDFRLMGLYTPSELDEVDTEPGVFMYASPVLGPNGEYLYAKYGGPYVFEVRNLAGQRLFGKKYENTYEAAYMHSGLGGVISPDGTWVAILLEITDYTGEFPSMIHSIGIWMIETGQEIQQLALDPPVSALAVSPDSTLLAVGTTNGTVQIWQLGSPQPLAEMQHEAAVTALDFSPNGQLVVSASNHNSDIKVWDVSGGELVTEVNTQSVSALSFGPDGRYIYAVNGLGGIRVISVTTGETVVQFTVPVKKMDQLMFSPDGHWLVTFNREGLLQIWDMLTGQEVTRRELPYGEMEFYSSSLAFSSTGEWVAYRYDDSLHIWVWHPDELQNQACARLSRNLSQAEWETYFPAGQPYHQTCPNLPMGEDVDTP
ncbi:MAG TPA: WD40 repeat domain-containing protein [Anaerolineaceae bacterium]|nr:WD40 repeat domain-containing protein [Anaerolineaceae bacterium]